MMRSLRKTSKITKTQKIWQKKRERSVSSVRNKQKEQIGGLETSKRVAPKITLYKKYKYRNTEVTEVFQPQKPSIFLNKKKTTTLIIQNFNSLIQFDGNIFNTLDNSYHETDWRVLNSKNIRCSCSKHQCQKLFCACFQRNVPCNSECGCVGCANSTRGIAKQIVLGCKCIKSKCITGYCECFNKGVNCGQNCQCCECKN